MESNEIRSAIEAILFAAGESVPAQRIALVLGVDTDTVFECAKQLADGYLFERRGIRLVRMNDSLQLCSSPEHSDLVVRALEQRKPPRLSQPALEVLAIAAYFQPVTRAYIDQVRGVDSSYTVGVLLERGLLEPCGRLDVPGRPTLYRTSEAFLRTMGITSLEELPELPDLGSEEGMAELKEAIKALEDDGEGQQLTITVEE
jgi:segregation and condensation protein B